MRDAAALLAVALLLASPAARAQSPGGIALDQLQPTPAGDSFAGVPSPFAEGHLVLRGIALFDYATRPLTVVSAGQNDALVAFQGYLHVGASFAVWDRLLISAHLPIALLQGGDSPRVGRYTFPSPSGAALGDLRLGLRVRLHGEDGSPFQVGAGAYLHLPTAQEGGYAGESAVRLTPALSLGGHLSRLVWSAALGADFHGGENPASLVYGAGAALLMKNGTFQIGPELYASTPLQDGLVRVDAGTAIPRGFTTNLELLLEARLRVVRGLMFGVLGGPGLTHAIGTPAFRAAMWIAWAPPLRTAEAPLEPVDTDEDGILDPDDACPYAFGVKTTDPKTSGCPPRGE